MKLERMNNPYCLKKELTLLPSFVCFVDILGYSELSKSAIKNGEGVVFLKKLRKALTGAYDRIRGFSTRLNGIDDFSIKVFTDNIVLGYPLICADYDKGEPEMGMIFDIFSEYQISLANEGFLVRGGIAFGNHYMDDEIVFGDALIEAVGQDKAGGPPRISFASSAVKKIQQQLAFYGEIKMAPHYDYLFEDADGTVFLNYLNETFYPFPHGPILFKYLEKHKEIIEIGLTKYKGHPSIRAKFEWAARYHNFVCNDFAGNNLVPEDRDLDEELFCEAMEAQRTKDFLIEIESFAASPGRMNLKPIRYENENDLK